MEAFQNNVNDKSIKVLGGAQYITTPGDHACTLDVKSGFPCMNICSYTDN